MLNYITKSPHIIITYILIGLCFFQTTSINDTLHSRVNPSLNKAVDGKLLRIRTLNNPPIDLNKVQKWTNKMIVTCFSLTKENYKSKSNYCANKYFSPVAKDLYLSAFVKDVGSELDAKTASHYIAMPTYPLTYRTNRKTIIRVVGYGVRSIVSARDIEPINFMINLYVKFTYEANNQYSLSIVGFDFK